MRPQILPLLIIVILALVPVTGHAQDMGRLVAQVALQPLPEAEAPDIEAALKANWRAYYNSGGAYGFFRDQVRAGRIDLNEDGQAELILLIDSPAWASDKGQPMVVFTWSSKGWRAIGYGFGDSDGVFVTSQRSDGWAGLDTPRQYWRWSKDSYRLEDKALPPVR